MPLTVTAGGPAAAADARQKNVYPANMGGEKQAGRKKGGNAFDRAAEAILALDTGWWTAFAGSDVAEFEISNPQFISLGDETTIVGGITFERRVIVYKARDAGDEEEEALITRPVMTRFSALPLAVLERLAEGVLDQAEAEQRQANIDEVVATAREFDEDERRSIALDILGSEASEQEIANFAEQLRMPPELVAGGDAAAKFFDDHVGTVRIAGEPGEEEVADEPLPPPGRTALIAGEWDFYTPEEVEDHGGPESDAAYAFRIVRLCRAIREEPEIATQLAMHVGAVTREWEMWRENAEFIAAGRERFAQQSRLARSRGERPWMMQVRKDLAEGRIGGNVAHYAREFRRKRRNLSPPSAERIRNFVSDLRKAPDA